MKKNEVSKTRICVIWKISQMIRKTISISMGILISYAMKQGIFFWVYYKTNETKHDHIFLMEGKLL